MSGFAVMAKPCRTCIFRKDSPLDLSKLLNDIRDPFMGFRGHRICHHSARGMPACCRGFWNAHKNDFSVGQMAQRLGAVVYVKGNEK